MERSLRDQYLSNLETLARELNAKNHDLAIAIAEVPDEIRGYGHVKEAAIEKSTAVEADLWAGWPSGDLPRTKTTLIAAG